MANPELHDDFTKDRIDRQTAFNNMCAVLNELCELTSTTPSDWRLPANCNSRPVRSRTEVRMKRPSTGEYIIFDKEAMTFDIELPKEHWGRPHGFATHVPDRCSIGCSLLHFLIHMGFLFTPWFDFFHCLWNCVRTASKRTGSLCHRKQGYLWKGILQFLVYRNMNYGPFRSGAWYETKKEGHSQSCTTEPIQEVTLRFSESLSLSRKR
jgi:hypothetical protein